ncbi:MAG: type II secretion system protein [Fibrobacterales bacterium]|nr:type II secretion system protein [Fibrobacterales bacterium]
MKQKGFTLIELMVVVVILGILAGIAVPKMFGLSDKSKVSEAPQVLKTYETLQQAYIAEQSKIGSFDSITFVKPGASQYFTYDEPESYNDESTKAGVAWATSRVKIGGCEANNVWTTCVPNGTKEIKRVVVTSATAAKCTELSPATYKETGTKASGNSDDCT